VKAVCSALGVAHSHVCVMAARPADWVDGRTVQAFHQPADAILVEAVRAEITALPTYGYRRAGALVNRTRTVMGLQTINHKRFYRVMKAHSLLLPKAPKRPDSGRVHDGVVAVGEPNQRWCSDGFEIACDNGEVVTGVFMKDVSVTPAPSGRSWLRPPK
jgi:putative transposase